MSQQHWLPDGSLQGRTAIVTGGAGSFGRIICHALARAGASVVVNDVGTAYSGHGASEGPDTDLAREICAPRIWEVRKLLNRGSEKDPQDKYAGTTAVLPHRVAKAPISGLYQCCCAYFSFTHDPPALTDERAIKDFELAWLPAGNVAIILAPATDACNFNGEFFSTGGYKVHRIVFGMLPGLQGVESSQAILDKQEQRMNGAD
ncbi:uncharacterized protein A1O5_11695 [Cladophialophora psammophila CBS 110553]|uniref:Uncharacterized protein n=1 Tax=Cladophialophora psammophila CBS 110553 TaxID=1182543 RepID=W9WYR9_9EURO|nr:uncharacterized protein A1O5_11695 [Cladophialophora psammophila CBS 110553]EXJ63374.1 hypothetical protein A1O5_11695 [Cladophialophora psammophila CBS 110553]